MLSACAALIDELGYDGITTTLIAERAGVAVGSLYQFFPDKRAVVQALTTRNLDTYAADIRLRLAGVKLEHWWDAVDTALDCYVQMYLHVPGFAKIRFGDVVDMRLMDADRENNLVVSDRLIALLTDRFDIEGEEVKLPVTVAVQAVDGILNLAFHHKLYPPDVVVTEARRIVRGYLAGALGTPGDPLVGDVPAQPKH
ncbi:MAG: TetR/AcrR family transcriptional regulator [Sciscionella sp.]